MTTGKMWKTGWVVLPPTAKTPELQVHRPHPARPAATMCDRVIGTREVFPVAPAGVRLCQRCEHKVSIARRHERKRNARELADRQQARTRVKIVDSDAYERLAMASTSVRAVGAGLPGLGWRR
jgi:hypothetical protein